MPLLSADTGHGPVTFYGDALHAGHDFRVRANAAPHQADVLLFFDSRGISAAWDGSLLQRLSDHFRGRPTLTVSRPLTMTTWATLYNFLKVNRLAPSLVVTNVGFVDTTPKKAAFCEDVVRQIEFGVPGAGCRLRVLEPYTLSSGVVEDLATVEYSDTYRAELKALCRRADVLAVKTPLVSPDLPLARTRPASFYTQLEAANALIDAAGPRVVETGWFDAGFTYDAVHWTPRANAWLFDRIKEHL